MTDTAPGYLFTRQAQPNRANWKDYTAYCARSGVPRVSITRATFFTVTVDAGTLPAGRFDEYDFTWLTDTAGAFLEGSPSKQPRVKALPVRVSCYGLTEETARRLAGVIANRFPPLATYTQPVRIAAPPKAIPKESNVTPQKEPPRRSLAERVYRPRKVVDLATERRRRRDPFGNPRDRGPA